MSETPSYTDAEIVPAWDSSRADEPSPTTLSIVPEVVSSPPSRGSSTTSDLGRGVRRFWRKQRLADTVDDTTLAQALAEVGILSLAHLARRLCSKKTPVEVKDKIALAMGPKLVVQLQGIGARGGTGGGEGASSDLLADYGVG